MSIRTTSFLITPFVLAMRLCAASGQPGEAHLASLLKAIPAMAQEGFGMDPAAEALARQIQAMGAPAVAPLVKLLSDGRPGVKAFAGFVLRDLETIPESALDALIHAHEQGNDGLSRAIARIGTPRAMAYLISDLRIHPRFYSQTGGALLLAGERAAPWLADLLKDEHTVDPELAGAVQALFSQMAGEAQGAVLPLVATAEDARRNPENRVEAVKALGCIGAAATAAVPALLRLAAAEPERFGAAVDDALVAIGTQEAVTILEGRLSPSGPENGELWRLASLGRMAKAAGPSVLAMLQHKDWETRVRAAKALGFLGWPGAVEPLRDLLGDTSDWRLVAAAAHSLGRLGEAAALPELMDVAQNHWFPPVRKAAEKASKVLRGVDAYPVLAGDNLGLEFFSYTEPDTEEAHDLEAPPEVPFTPIYLPEPGRLDEAALEACAYEVPFKPEEGPESKWAVRPFCGLWMASGLLLGVYEPGSNQQVLFKNQTGTTRMIEDCVRSFHRLGGAVIAVCGVAGCSGNYGNLYRITWKADGTPEAALWKVLPGAPGQCGLLENGDLCIECWGGPVIVTPKGEMRMASAP